MQLFRTKSVEQTIAETGEEGRKLKRNLTWWDLSIMGVAVAVGAGIFSVGAQAAAFHAGPAVIISFLIAGIVWVVPEFLRTLVFARPRGDDQFADCTFSPSLDMSR